MGGRASPSFSEKERKGLDLDTVTVATHESLDARSICLAIVCTSVHPSHAYRWFHPLAHVLAKREEFVIMWDVIGHQWTP
ncbi:hypothetical protein TNIN_374071 [Trichonephila inaurata madagascariensis]|uniref:Uncharacterized protein n=1 Tax=Trichonephila inaurata madagascariensis TaxID=2747483 RepID=A0A8X6WVG7_9ARAC|nr:hypothetical protein TNIN_374071 [Trichonephila inaurata madagascariensis]